MRAIIFPGQGAQNVGMGKLLSDNFTAARDVFGEVDEALKQNLSKIIFEGPEIDLTRTENTQPALMATSIAALRVLQTQCGLDVKSYAKYVAGHSLGEYSALVAAGTLTITQAARLLKLRGNAMQKAVPAGAGAMAALIGADIIQAEAIAEEASSAGICEVSNDNAPGQIVISGAMAAIDKAIEIASAHGVKKAVKLNVSAPFHCSMMQPAANEMREALMPESLKSPVVELVANVTAMPASEPNHIKELLVAQVTKPVRWRESVLTMKAAGVQEYLELGSGKVLTGLIKRIDKDALGINIETPHDIDAFIKIGKAA